MFLLSEVTLSYLLDKDDMETLMQALKQSQKGVNAGPDLRTTFLLQPTSTIPLSLFWIWELQMYRQCGRNSSAGKACEASQHTRRRRASLSVQLLLLSGTMRQHKRTEV